MPDETGPRPGSLPLRAAPATGLASRPEEAAGLARHGDARPRSRPRLTSRGALVVMVAAFLAGNLLAAGIAHSWPAGLGFAAGCLLAVAYARRESMLLVVVAPPVIFLITLVGAELITASSASALATAEGVLLTLAGTAPWLFGVMIITLVIAMMRGLPSCIRRLGAELAGRPELETASSEVPG